MPKVDLSSHFRKNWRERVGTDPQPEAVMTVIRESIQVQRCVRFRLENGETATQLAIYWHPKLDMVVTVDNYTRKAVSVLTGDMGRVRRRPRTAPGPTAMYTPMTMHRR